MRATREYRRDQDPIGEFLHDRCILDPGDESNYEPAGILYAAYEEHCQAHNVEPLSQRGFGRTLRERGCNPVRTENTRMWTGIQLRPAGGDDTYDGS